MVKGYHAQTENDTFFFLLGSANATQTSHIKLHYKRRTVEEIIKKIQTLGILKRFSHIQNNSWYQIFLCAFLFAQVQENPVSLAQRYQKLKAHLIVLLLAYCFTLD